MATCGPQSTLLVSDIHYTQYIPQNAHTCTCHGEGCNQSWETAGDEHDETTEGTTTSPPPTDGTTTTTTAAPGDATKISSAYTVILGVGFAIRMFL